MAPGQAQFLTACYGPAAWAALETAFAAGARSRRRPCLNLPLARVDEDRLTRAGIEFRTLTDVDTPDGRPPDTP